MIRYLFPTIIFQRTLTCKYSMGDDLVLDDTYMKMLKDEMDAMRRRDPVGRQISNAYTGWQSNDGVDNNPVFQKLMNRITTIFHQEVWPFYGIDPHNMQFQMGNCWSNINDKTAWNKPHLHNGCWYSGVFYIHADGDEGNFSAINTDPKVVSDMPNSNRQQESWDFEPKTGELILFPSGMMHMVAPNLTDKDRYSISFNSAYTVNNPEAYRNNFATGWHPEEATFHLDEKGTLIQNRYEPIDWENHRG